MTNFKNILDAPNSKPKLRKFYFTLLERFILAYPVYLAIHLLIILILYISKGNYADLFLISIFYYLIGIFFSLMYLLAITSIFYRWRKRSIEYDESFDKSILEGYCEEISNYKYILLIVPFISIFAATLLIYSNYKQNTIHSSDDYIWLSLILYSICCSSYYFIVYFKLKKFQADNF